jgi:hypothetical protein
MDTGLRRYDGRKGKFAYFHTPPKSKIVWIEINPKRKSCSIPDV